MDTVDKKALAEKLHALMMEMNNEDDYSAQNSIFGDLYNALKKIDVVNIESTIDAGQVIYHEELVDVYTTKQLTDALINGINTLSSDEWVSFYKDLVGKSSAKHWSDIENVAIESQDGLEERLKYDTKNSQEFICEKYCLSFYKGLIEENVGGVYPCA